MTVQDLYMQLGDFANRIKKEFGADTLPVRGAELTAAHMLWMIDEGKRLLAAGRVPAAARVIGILQYTLLTFGLITAPEIEQQNADIVDTFCPAPANMNTMLAKVHVALATPIGAITTLVRRTWLPEGLQPQMVKFPNIDIARRLPVLEDLGIFPEWEIQIREWDYTDVSLNLYLKPVFIDPKLSEESVALAVSMYRAAGWDYPDDDAKKWPERLIQHRKAMAKGHSPSCPNHPQNHGQPPTGHGPLGHPFGDMLSAFLMQSPMHMKMMQQPHPQHGVQPHNPNDFSDVDDDDFILDLDEDEEPLPPKKKRRRRKKRKPGGEPDGDENEGKKPGTADGEED